MDPSARGLRIQRGGNSGLLPSSSGLLLREAMTEELQRSAQRFAADLQCGAIVIVPERILALAQPHQIVFGQYCRPVSCRRFVPAQRQRGGDDADEAEQQPETPGTGAVAGKTQHKGEHGKSDSSQRMTGSKTWKVRACAGRTITS